MLLDALIAPVAGLLDKIIPDPRARDAAKRIAGARYDVKRFHDVLELGAMPLSMLERLVEERARAV